MIMHSACYLGLTRCSYLWAASLQYSTINIKYLASWVYAQLTSWQYKVDSVSTNASAWSALVCTVHVH